MRRVSEYDERTRLAGMGPGRVLLVGTDFEGDPREFWMPSLEHAREMARMLIVSDESGPAWKNYAIWWNNPEKNGEWEPVEVYPAEGQNLGTLTVNKPDPAVTSVESPKLEALIRDLPPGVPETEQLKPLLKKLFG